MLRKIKRGNEKITDFSQLSYRLRMEKNFSEVKIFLSKKITCFGVYKMFFTIYIPSKLTEMSSGFTMKY